MKTTARDDPKRGMVVKLSVEVHAGLDRGMRLYALQRSIPLWRAWEEAAGDLVERESQAEPAV